MSEEPSAEGFFKRTAEAGARKAPHPVHLVLAVATVVLVLVVLVPTRDELLYHLRPPAVVDLGSVAGLPPDTHLPVGARVRASAVLGNRAAEIPLWRRGSLRLGPIVVRQVMGAALFVEYDPRLHPSWGTFVEVELDARVLSFDDPALADARAVIQEQGLAVPRDARVLVADERPGEMGRYTLAWTGGLALVILALRSLRLGALRLGSLRLGSLSRRAPRR